MVSYHKQKRQWEREYRRSGGASSTPRREWKELTIPKDLRDPSGNSFNLPRSGTSGVPTVGKTPRRNLWQLPAERGEPMWGSSRDIRRKAGRILRGAAFKFAVGNYDLFYQIGKELWDYQRNLSGQPVPIDPGSERAPSNFVGSQLDGYDYYVDVPAGWVSCNYQAPWAPGTPGEFGVAHVYRSAGHVINNEPCTWYGGNWDSPIQSGPSPVSNVWSMYVGSYWFTKAWQSFVPGTGDPNVWPQAFRVPVGSSAPSIGTPSRSGFLPSLPWSIPWMPSQIPVPFSWRSVLRDAAIELGIREDSGYDVFDAPATEPSTQVVVTIPPNKPPTIGTGVNPRPPYRPPGSRTDRKVKIVGLQAFQMVQGIFHKATEWGDLQDAIYAALPKKYQVCEGHNFTCKTGVILIHWDKIDVVEAIVNVVANEIMDRVYGRGVFGSVDKAARRLGTHGYKVLNAANKSPMQEAVGEVIKEVEKRFTNPTKEQITSVVKDFFGV